MVGVSWIKRHALTVLGYEKRPKQLALAAAVAFYIAFSPFLGLHTAMVFGAAWLLGLSLPVIFIVSTVIHNPWTMVPVYGAGYFFGVWFLDLCAINHYAYNPGWITYISDWLTPILGTSQISLLAFLVGGNLLGVLGAFLIYPLVLKIVERMQKESDEPAVIAGAYTESGHKEPGSSVLQRVIPAAQLRKRGYETSSSK